MGCREMKQDNGTGTWLEAIAGLLILVGILCGIAALVIPLFNLPPKILPDGRIAIPLECYFLVAFGLCMLIGGLIPCSSSNVKGGDNE